MNGEEKIEGKEDNGSAVIQGTPVGLRIYLQRSDTQDTGTSLVFISRMEEFLGLNQPSRNLFDKVMMSNEDDQIRELLEQHGIDDIEELSQQPANDCIAGSDDDEDQYDSEFDTSLPSVGDWARKSPTPDRTHAGREGRESRTDIQPPAGSQTNQKLGSARRSSGSLLRSPSQYAQRPVSEVFQNITIVDTTPLSSTKTSGKIPRTVFNMTELSAALLSLPPTRNTLGSPSLSPRPRSMGMRRLEPPASTDEISSKLDRRQQEIGFYGELFVFQHLKQILGSSIDHKNWTSCYRNRAFADPLMHQGDCDHSKCNHIDCDHSKNNYNDFAKNEERHYSDFTFTDTDGKLTDYLIQHGRRLPRWGGSKSSVTYHLEVKSTTGPLEEPFHLSNNQLQLARQWTLAGPSLNVYVVLRVYELDFESKFSANVVNYVDPWRMVFDGTLLLRTSDQFNLTPTSNL